MEALKEQIDKKTKENSLKIYITVLPLNIKIGTIVSKKDQISKIALMIVSKMKALGYNYEVFSIIEKKTFALLLPESLIGDFLKEDDEVIIVQKSCTFANNNLNKGGKSGFPLNACNLDYSEGLLKKKRKKPKKSVTTPNPNNALKVQKKTSDDDKEKPKNDKSASNNVRKTSPKKNENKQNQKKSEKKETKKNNKETEKQNDNDEESSENKSEKEEDDKNDESNDSEEEKKDKKKAKFLADDEESNSGSDDV